MISKFRKKPVVIEAIQWHGYNFSEVLALAQSASFLDGILHINTLEGVMRANVGDWIIKGVKGELYPCKPDIFEATYERVEG